MRIVRALNLVVRQGVNTPATVNALAADGSEPAPPMLPDDMKKKIGSDYARLEKLINTIKVSVQ